MKTEIAPSSIEAVTHMEDYTTMIRTKNEELKNRKDIQSDTRKELLAYVQSLKSTPEHQAMAARYHEDAKKARVLFSAIIEGSDLVNNPDIKNTFASIKQYVQGIDEKQWKKHIRTLQKFFSILSPNDKEKLLRRIWRKTEDPEMIPTILHEIQEKKPHMSLGKKVGEVRSKTIGEWPLMPIFGIFCGIEDLVVFFNREKADYRLIYLLLLMVSAAWVISVPMMLKEKNKELDDCLKGDRQRSILGRGGYHGGRDGGCDHSEI